MISAFASAINQIHSVTSLLEGEYADKKLFRKAVEILKRPQKVLKTKIPIKVTKEILNELGERLYAKITETVIPEWTEAFKQITKQDCIDYIYELTIPRTYDGFLTEKSIVNDYLVKIFPIVKFEESDSDLDHSGDVDYIGWVGKKAFGIQIKPITANANFGNYKLTERMQANFEEFEDKYGGRVFVVFSSKVRNKKEIRNKEVLDEIAAEIKRLEGLSK